MPRRKRVVIRTPFPTTEEVRIAMGVSKKRVKELKVLMAKILDKEDRKRA